MTAQATAVESAKGMPSGINNIMTAAVTPRLFKIFYRVSEVRNCFPPIMSSTEWNIERQTKVKKARM